MKGQMLWTEQQIGHHRLFYLDHGLLISNKDAMIWQISMHVIQTECVFIEFLIETICDILFLKLMNRPRVRERTFVTDAMFHPMKDALDLVKSYGDEVPEQLLFKLQELPHTWETLKKQCDLVRQNVAPLKAAEVNGIRKRCTRFDTRQQAYRDKFKGYSFFNFDTELPYWRMEKVSKRLKNLEDEEYDLQTSAELFEINIPDFKFLKICRRELRMLKEF
ncbi:unnamed protein product, partial [Meganyctiphanes norvegica]